MTNCFSAEGFGVLLGLKDLEVLSIPSISRMDERDVSAIAALKDHSKLRLSKAGKGSDLVSMETFWKDFEHGRSRRSIKAKVYELTRHGDFAEAVRLMEGLARTEEDSFSTLFSLGVMLFANEDVAAYQDLCRKMVEKFRRRVEGDEVAVRLCVLGSDCGVPLNEVRRLMPHLALVNPRSYYRCWFVLSNGLLEYRAGRYLAAIEILSELKTSRFTSALSAGAATLSMAYVRLGELEAANAQLSHASRLLKDEWENGAAEQGTESEWLFAKLLSKEAEQTLRAATSSATVK
jgi:hypothetical protein